MKARAVALHKHSMNCAYRGKASERYANFYLKLDKEIQKMGEKVRSEYSSEK